MIVARDRQRAVVILLKICFIQTAYRYYGLLYLGNYRLIIQILINGSGRCNAVTNSIGKAARLYDIPCCKNAWQYLPFSIWDKPVIVVRFNTFRQEIQYRLLAN